MPVCWRYLRLAISVSPGLISLLCLIVAIVIFTCMSSLERKENTCLYVGRKQLENHTHFEQFKVLLRGRVLKQMEENEYSYCFCSQQDLDFLQWLLSKPNTDEIAQSTQVSTEGVSAHHRLLRPDDTVQESGLFSPHQFLMLDPEVENTELEHAQNVQVIPTGYLIRYPGVYHLYMQAVPDASLHDLCNELTDTPWQISIVLIRPKEPLMSGTLLTTDHSSCGSYVMKGTNDFIKDVLSVLVSDSRLVQLGTNASFFGLMQL